MAVELPRLPLSGLVTTTDTPTTHPDLAEAQRLIQTCNGERISQNDGGYSFLEAREGVVLPTNKMTELGQRIAKHLSRIEVTIL